jgi:galacturan 1,4-alpha-galacturonidase
VSVNVRDHGAVGDGRANDTPALQAAINSAAGCGGGVVVLPAGRYLSGAVRLASGVTLRLQGGAVLAGSDDPGLYRPAWFAGDGLAPLIGARDAEDVAIEGSGTIDGCGQPWWDRFAEWRRAGGKEADPGRQALAGHRPKLMMLEGCRNLRLAGLTLRNSPSWTVHLQRCHDVVMDSLRLSNPPHAPNSDGLNPISCRNVRISNCLISVGDDAITLKSGVEGQGLPPCENIAIVNCIVESGHGGVVIGSEMSGGVRNVTVSNCVFDGTYRGIRIKTRRGRGGAVEHVLAQGIIMRDVPFPLLVDAYYYDFDEQRLSPRPADAGTPAIRHVHLRDIDAYNARKAAHLVGLPEMPLEDFSLSGVRVEARRGIMARCIRGLRLMDMDIRPHEGPPLTAELVEGIRCDDTIAPGSGPLELHEGQYKTPLKD